MDNQHKQIKGYRDLSQEEIDLMNEIKLLAEQVGKLVDKIEKFNDKDYFDEDEDIANAGAVAMHWISTGKRDLQLGFMQLTRAVAKPTTF